MVAQSACSCLVIPASARSKSCLFSLSSGRSSVVALRVVTSDGLCRGINLPVSLLRENAMLIFRCLSMASSLRNWFTPALSMRSGRREQMKWSRAIRLMNFPLSLVASLACVMRLEKCRLRFSPILYFLLPRKSYATFC